MRGVTIDDHFRLYDSETLNRLHERSNQRLKQWTETESPSDFGKWTDALLKFSRMKAEFAAVMDLIEMIAERGGKCFKSDISTDLPLDKMLEEGLVEKKYGYNPRYVKDPLLLVTEKGKHDRSFM